MGGIWTEALEDVAIVPLPVDAARVEAALRSLRGAPLFAGGRGAGRSDLDAVRELAAASATCCSTRALGCSS